jgi:hypothetical protein
VNRPIFAVALQNEDTWPFCKCGIFLDDHRIFKRPNNIVQNNIIRGKLPEAMQRYMNLAATNQLQHMGQDVAHGEVTPKRYLKRDNMSHSAATTRFFPLASRRASTGAKNLPV